MTERIGPFYEFMTNRLVRLHGNAFYSYLDAFGQQPYAYFSSYGRRNGYNKYFTHLGDSDCSRLGVWPYARSLAEKPDYINANSFQIISAGADGKFGRGSILPNGLTWDPKDTSRLDPAGRDDQANFHSLLLGVRAE